MNKTNVAHIKEAYGYIYHLVHTEFKYKLNQNNRLIDSVVFFVMLWLDSKQVYEHVNYLQMYVFDPSLMISVCFNFTSCCLTFVHSIQWII